MKGYWITVTITLLLFFCFAAIFITPSYGDELNYHYPLARKITIRQVLDPKSDYSSAYTPLPYFFGKAFLKLHDSLITLRVLNYFIFVALALFIFLLARHYTTDYRTIALLMLLNPYLLLSSFVYFMYDWGLLFAILGLYFHMTGKSKTFASMFFSMAVLCQQWLLMIIPAVFLHEWRESLEGRLPRRRLAAWAAVQGICLSPAFFLFARWGGLVHPNFSSHALVPGLWHLVAVLAMTGFLLLPPMLAKWRIFVRGDFLPLLFLLPLFWLAVPGFRRLSDLTHISGYFSHMLVKLEQHLKIPYRLSMFIFAVFGLLVLVAIAKKEKIPDNRVLAYTVFGLFAAFSASVRLTIGHIHMAVPFLVLLFHTDISSSKKVQFLMIGQYLLVCIIYLIDLVFFKARGILL